ncbi:MAG: hypothetical protein AAB738_03550 [Patescibacteria group bacterium]
MFKYFRLVNLFALLFVFLFLTPSFSFGAPAMRGVAVNETTRECGGYWQGDEYKQFSLPLGWVAYYPVEESGSYFITIGNRKIEDSWKDADICEKLGYKYVGENIGKPVQMAGWKDQVYYALAAIVVVLIGLIFFTLKVFKKRKI